MVRVRDRVRVRVRVMVRVRVRVMVGVRFESRCDNVAHCSLSLSVVIDVSSPGARWGIEP
jgi:hypothetical protein